MRKTAPDAARRGSPEHLDRDREVGEPIPIALKSVISAAGRVSRAPRPASTTVRCRRPRATPTRAAAASGLVGHDQGGTAGQIGRDFSTLGSDRADRA
jgi:hypothetical protein